jgi:phage tail sheath gpL-like
MGVTASAVARVVGIDTQFKDLRISAALSLPQRIAILAQGASTETFPLTAYRITSAQDAALRFGFGSMIHLAAREIFPENGTGVGSIPVVVLPVEDPTGGATAGAGTITPSGPAVASGTFYARVAGIKSKAFGVAAGDSLAIITAKFVAAINGILQMPVIASTDSSIVTLTAKWSGTSGNGITVEVLDGNDEVPTTGLTFVCTPTTGGTGAADIAPALSELGSPWTTLIVNGFPATDTAVLDALNVLGEGRWDMLVRRPFVAVAGLATVDVNTATAVTDARKTDRVNCQVVCPGSVAMPCQIAGAHVREIAKVADSNPPTDYGARALRALLPGVDADQWTYAERDQAVKAGSSTIEVRDGVVQISDVVTNYHPVGEEPPAFRYVVDLMKLFTVIYNVDLEFTKAEWNGAPLIPDGQPTSNPNARTPKAAKAAMCAIIDGLALAAIISDPKTAKKNTVASISATNPKRLDIQSTIQLSGNTNVISMDLYFGFFFGAPVIVG